MAKLSKQFQKKNTDNFRGSPKRYLVAFSNSSRFGQMFLLLFLFFGPLPLLSQELSAVSPPELINSTSSALPTPEKVSTPQTSETASQPIQVEVGMFFLDISKLDLRECEFHADFYVWYRVPASFTTTWTPELVEFINGTVESASPIASSTLDNGDHYWTQRIKAVFRGKFDLRHYPLDEQSLTIVIEDSEQPSAKVIYLPDSAAEKEGKKWLDPYLEIQDWNIKGAEIISDIHHYQTDFGVANGDISTLESRYSRLTFKINISRIFLPHMIKFVLPLMIIAGMAYLVFWINAAEFESQCAICVTSLLSAVALHSSLAGTLPEVGYMVMADKIFILFYLNIFIAMVQTVAANNNAKTGGEAAAARLDVAFRYLFPISFAVGTLVIWASGYL